jgi:tetratricopeptide (TPR) repeat protein
MGNNEMAGPFGALSMFGARAPSLAWIRALLVLKTSRLGQALGTIADTWRDPGAKPAAWRGLGMFAGQQLDPADPARTRVHEHFRANLQAMVAAAAGRKIPVLVCTVASNLRDCAPFASIHAATLSREAQTQWEKSVGMGVADFQAGRPADALAKYAAARQWEARSALLEYLEGRGHQALTNLPAALEHFRAARDLDALPFRTDSTLNKIAADVVETFRERGAALVDVERALAAPEPPGHALFLDHVHLSFEGNYRVARELAVAVEATLPESARSQSAVDWAAQEVVEQRLGLTDWNRHGAYEAMMQRCQDAPFTNQVNHGEHIAALRNRVIEVRERLHPRLYVEAGDLYREAIARSPTDPLLYESQAEFLEATQQPSDALGAWSKVVELVPNHPAGWYNVGRLMGQQGRFAEARTAFENCLAQRPGEVEVLLEMGRMLTLQTNHHEAIALFEKLRKRFPEDPRILRNLAEPLAAAGRRAEAVGCLEQAVRLRPSYWEARYLLGVERAVDGKVLEAAKEFEAVLRLRPDHVLSRLNFGVALVRLGQMEPARRQFEEVLRLNPQNARARQHLDALEQLLQKRTNAPVKP